MINIPHFIAKIRSINAMHAVDSKNKRMFHQIINEPSPIRLLILNQFPSVLINKLPRPQFPRAKHPSPRSIHRRPAQARSFLQPSLAPQIPTGLPKSPAFLIGLAGPAQLRITLCEVSEAYTGVRGAGSHAGTAQELVGAGVAATAVFLAVSATFVVVF